MPQAPPGIEILDTLKTDRSRVLYRARQVQLDRPVLLIGLAPGVLSSSPLSKRLEAEAQVLAELDHPNVLRLFDFVRTEEDFWLVLEEVDGPVLSELIGKEIPWQAVAATGLDLCRALTHAHRLGHHHGSLTAHVVQYSNKGRTKLSGFGRNVVSESDQVELLDTESRGGLSPETSIGQAHSPLSDLFALGALLYEMASDRPPFGSIDAIDYPKRVRNETPEPLVKVAPHLPHALTSLIEQMLEKLPANRPAHAAAVAEQLEGLIGGTTLPLIATALLDLGFNHVEAPMVPVPLGTPYRPRSGIFRRNAGLVASILLGLTGLGVGISAFVHHQARDASSSPVSAVAPQDTAMHLRVVASPWAHVYVDGKKRETTPFAHPIDLPPGAHVVRLQHPNAPSEERTITGQEGQVVLLNVQMHVKVELPSSLPVGEVKESTP